MGHQPPVSPLRLAAPPGYTFEAVQVPWKRAQELAKIGKIDLLVNLRITPERQEWLKFSGNPTFLNPIAVFMLENRAFPLRSWDLLKPLLGGVSLGDTFGNGFDEYLRANLKVESALSMVENFRKLDAGRIDYFVTGLNTGLAWLAAVPLPHKVVALSPSISNEAIHLGISALSPHGDLLVDLDRRLAQLRSDGQLEKILTRNLEKYTVNPVGFLP